MYTIKEIYFTIQGEGFHTGRSAVFVRFTGCNLWTGYEKDRLGAVCDFCDCSNSMLGFYDLGDLAIWDVVFSGFGDFSDVECIFLRSF